MKLVLHILKFVAAIAFSVTFVLSSPVHAAQNETALQDCLAAKLIPLPIERREITHLSWWPILSACAQAEKTPDMAANVATEIAAIKAVASWILGAGAPANRSLEQMAASGNRLAKAYLAASTYIERQSLKDAIQEAVAAVDSNSAPDQIASAQAALLALRLSHRMRTPPDDPLFQHLMANIFEARQAPLISALHNIVTSYNNVKLNNYFKEKWNQLDISDRIEIAIKIVLDYGWPADTDVLCKTIDEGFLEPKGRPNYLFYIRINAEKVAACPKSPQENFNTAFKYAPYGGGGAKLVESLSDQLLMRDQQLLEVYASYAKPGKNETEADAARFCALMKKAADLNRPWALRALATTKQCSNQQKQFEAILSSQEDLPTQLFLLKMLSDKRFPWSRFEEEAAAFIKRNGAIPNRFLTQLLNAAQDHGDIAVRQERLLPYLSSPRSHTEISELINTVPALRLTEDGKTSLSQSYHARCLEPRINRICLLQGCYSRLQITTAMQPLRRSKMHCGNQPPEIP